MGKLNNNCRYDHRSPALVYTQHLLLCFRSTWSTHNCRHNISCLTVIVGNRVNYDVSSKTYWHYSPTLHLTSFAGASHKKKHMVTDHLIKLTPYFNTNYHITYEAVIFIIVAMLFTRVNSVSFSTSHSLTAQCSDAMIIHNNLPG